jgi:TRAP-type C4-dicarboxylate transport system substrate-binding protein
MAARLAAAAVALGSLAGPAGAQEPVHLRVVGGLANVNQYVRHEKPFWSQELPRLLPGRLTTEIVPYDEAGLSPPELFRAVQMGSVPIGTVLLSVTSALEPEIAGPDLAGLNPDFVSVQRTLKAYRPRLERLLRQKYGVNLLAVYAYPAQVVFCAKPFKELGDLRGRRVRVSSASQADFISGLGAQPVQLPFAQVTPAMRAGTLDCAITGTMSGNTVGLHEVTTHVSEMALSWGLATVVAHAGRWDALPQPVRSMIEQQLPRLEQAIWAESERETVDGLACNAGQPTCKGGRRGQMTRVPVTPADENRRRELLQQQVVPAWLQRCGEPCATAWRQTLGPAAGLAVKP